jgi:pimeloyl-ACP methyl ester carboxylesterase
MSKLALALLMALVILLAVNTALENGDTKGAKADIGRIVNVNGRQVQVREDGPRRGKPIVLLHCFSCSMHWWDRITPLLARDHRVIRIDLLGHGGSEKPSSGYKMQDQATLVAATIRRLGVKRATFVGHSMGATVLAALNRQDPGLVRDNVVIDEAPNSSYDSEDILFSLSVFPVIGQATKRLAPDSLVKKGLEQAFAPGFKVPDQFVKGLDGMTYTAFSESADQNDSYRDGNPLDKTFRAAHKPLLVIFGADDQLVKRAGYQAYAKVPRVRQILVEGAGHSPAVEKPSQTARYILDFAP